MSAKFLRIGLWEFIPSFRVSLIPSAKTLTVTLSWLCFAAYFSARSALALPPMEGRE